MKKPLICHVLSGYYRDDARILYRQCLTLKEDGFDVCIITNDGQPDGEIEGVKIFSCVQSEVLRWKTLMNATSQFLDHCLKIDADVYQLHSPELLRLGLKLKKFNKTVVYDAHEDMRAHIREKEWLPPWSRWLASELADWYINIAFKKIDQIISPHPHVVKRIQDKFSKGLAISNFPIVTKKANANRRNFLSRENIFCYSGTVYSYSNQLVISQSVASLEGVHYWIAGYMEADQEELLKNSPGYSKIKYFGRLNKSGLANFYDQSFAGIVLYDYRRNLGNKVGSFGTNKIFEYMAAGIPIICTDFDLWRDIIDRYDCGIYIQPNDKDALTTAMATLLSDKDAAYRMGKNGRRAIEKEFNWHSQGLAYCRLMRDILKV